MSAMVNLEIPWINVMSKMDLVTPNSEDPSGGARNGIRGRKNIARCVWCFTDALSNLLRLCLDIWTLILSYLRQVTAKKPTRPTRDSMTSTRLLCSWYVYRDDTSSRFVTHHI